MWKWAISIYIVAWCLTFASISSFFYLLQRDQMCQTGLIFGMELWRTITIILSVFISPIALIIELLFNKIPIYFVHIFFSILSIFLYIGWTCVQSVLMKEPVYGQHLAYEAYNSTKSDANIIYFDWTYQYTKYLNSTRILSRISYCRQYYIDQNVNYIEPGNMIQPNYTKTFITLTLMVASVVLGHLILWACARFIKNNNAQILPFNKDIEDLEKKIKSCADDHKEALCHAKSELEQKIDEVRKNKREKVMKEDLHKKVADSHRHHH